MEADACILPLPYEYSKYLFYSSFLIGASSFICAYYQDYLTFVIMFMMFLSSIHFWYRPDYGVGRDIDMFLCKCIVIYFYGNALFYYDEYCLELFMNSFVCVLFFYASELVLYSLKNKKWIVFHMAIHFYLSLFTPFILYIL
jgi:hypothetical protein